MTKSIHDLKQDKSNPNKGNSKGNELIGKSLDKFGTGRSILVDKNDNIIAGNHVQEEAAKRDIPIRVIETDGSELIVVKRTDVDLYSEEGREMSLADNATAKANITWDNKVLKSEFKDVKILKDWGLPKLEPIKPTVAESFHDDDQEYDDEGDIPEKDDQPKKEPLDMSNRNYPLSIILNAKEYKEWQDIKKSMKERSDTVVFKAILNQYQQV